MAWRDGGEGLPTAAGPGGRNGASLLRMVLIVGSCAIGALFVPAFAYASVFGTFLMLAVVVAAIAATGARDRLLARHLTRWDEATLYFVLGGAANMVSDQTAAGQSALSLLP